MLFANERRLELGLPAKDEQDRPANVAFLIRYLCLNCLKDPRAELFVLDDNV
jgi:ubiquitin related modifier 1